MRLNIAAAILVALATTTPGLAADDAPYIGSWDCGVATFHFTDTTYDSGEGPMPILKVEKEDGNYTLSFADGYQIGLGGVTATDMQWVSLATGDTFDCTRVKP